MRSDDLSHVWIGTPAGEFLRADTITGLSCTSGAAYAYCSDGRTVRLAGPGCPADFHVQLLGELGRARADARWLLIISPEASRVGSQWIQHRVDDLTKPASNGPPM